MGEIRNERHPHKSVTIYETIKQNLRDLDYPKELLSPTS